MDEARALWMWEKRLREWVDGYMFNKQYEEYPYCQQERKKQWQGWHYKEKTYNSNYLQEQGIG